MATAHSGAPGSRGRAIDLPVLDAHGPTIHGVRARCSRPSQCSTARLALISVPGLYAGFEAMKALQAGMHVMLFSDNVPVTTEVELKHFALARSLLMLGPDCGTAIINGVPLGADCFAPVCRPRDARVSGNDCHSQRRPDRASLCWPPGRPASNGTLVILALLAFVPASDLAIALLNRSVAVLVTPDMLPPARAARRRAVASSNNGRRADAADRRRRGQGADRAARGPLPGQPGRRRALRHPLRLDRCIRRQRAGDDATLDAARQGIARLNRRHGTTADGGARFLLFHRRRLSNAASTRGWDGSASGASSAELNRLLRGATNAHFPAHGLRGAVRGPLRHHARRRHPAATEAVQRLVGTMASPQPAATRSRTAPRRRRLRGAPAAGACTLPGARAHACGACRRARQA